MTQETNPTQSSPSQGVTVPAGAVVAAAKAAVVATKVVANIAVVAIGAAAGCWIYHKLTGSRPSGDSITTQ